MSWSAASKRETTSQTANHGRPQRLAGVNENNDVITCFHAKYTYVFSLATSLLAKFVKNVENRGVKHFRFFRCVLF